MSSTPSGVIRVLVVDDSFFMRKVLRDLLDDSGGAIQVLDTAQDGKEGVDKALRLRPDVITLDYEMPSMDGLQALETIMRERPTPVVMVSSHTGKGTEISLRALEMGAVDCVAKPAGRALENIRLLQPELIEKIKLAAVSRPQAPRRARAKDLGTPGRPASRPDRPQTPSLPARFIVAVASSTGGPRALHDLFQGLRPHPLVAYVIVQHISQGFTQPLARRLEESTSFRVTEAMDGAFLAGGEAYIAPTGLHLVLEGSPGHFKFAFRDTPPRLGVRPCADILMESVAQKAGKNCLGLVLTGMGKDGTEGLRAIRKAGGETFAQDAGSCVVYGMPRSAVEAGVVDHQLGLLEMAEGVDRLLSSRLPA